MGDGKRAQEWHTSVCVSSLPLFPENRLINWRCSLRGHPVTIEIFRKTSSNINQLRPKLEACVLRSGLYPPFGCGLNSCLNGQGKGTTGTRRETDPVALRMPVDGCAGSKSVASAGSGNMWGGLIGPGP